MVNPYAKQQTNSKEQMVLEYAPIVKHIANRLASRMPSNVDRDDLIQSGMIGLLEAADKFDKDKGVKFKTYAEIRVRGAMLDDLRSKDWIPRSVRESATKLETAFRSLRAKDIDHPTDKQLAKELEVAPKELVLFLEKAKPIPMLSIEGLGANSGDDSGLDFSETLTKDEDANPFTSIMGEEAQDVVREAVERLPEKEQMVLALYYNEELNLKEIGAVLDLTESRVSQLRTKAIAMLRSYMKEFIEADHQ
ncbi:MAG: FliA/WhiG family RNA polymerase sigma factor [SAR324 cluster bacterium]|nr:FliA/WhiG family RNA polymerase sigma factor [SAR324 cluster bacterium]